jgi:hypothetical protein
MLPLSLPRERFSSTINILGWYFPNFRVTLLHPLKNEKRKLHHKINAIELFPSGILGE